jgi:nucleotide-binding universal stress UspA family protein
MKTFHHLRLLGNSNAPRQSAAERRADQCSVAHLGSEEDPRPVLVAVDGSRSGWDALDWAAAEAAARQCELGVVHEFAWPLCVDSFGVLHARVYDPDTVEAAEHLVLEAVRRAHLVAPDLGVRTHLQAGAPASGICPDAGDGALVVLGREQRAGAFGRSMPQRVLRRASDTVAVVGLSSPEVGSGRAVARVVVGIDDPRDSAPVLGFAFRAARRRGLGITVLHVWSPRGHSEFDALGDEPPGSEFAKRRQLDAIMPGWSDVFPDVDVKRRLVRGPVGPALVAESDSAALLVIGSRSHGRRWRPTLGSISKAVARSARCPVVVVRRTPDADAEASR